MSARRYARAVLQIGVGRESKLDTEQRVSVRLHRQQVLHRPGPPRLWAVVDALRRPIGRASVARAQLRHLIKMARLSYVSISPLSGCTTGTS